MANNMSKQLTKGHRNGWQNCLAVTHRPDWWSVPEIVTAAVADGADGADGR